MKINSIKVNGTLPIRVFEADNLSNMVFLAGPNGIGKTRLIQGILAYFKNPTVNPQISFMIAATSKQERDAWGDKSTLDLSNQNHVKSFTQTLQKNQTRRNYKSSVLYYESNRQIAIINSALLSWQGREVAGSLAR